MQACKERGTIFGCSQGFIISFFGTSTGHRGLLQLECSQADQKFWKEAVRRNKQNLWEQPNAKGCIYWYENVASSKGLIHLSCVWVHRLEHLTMVKESIGLHRWGEEVRGRERGRKGTCKCERINIADGFFLSHSRTGTELAAPVLSYQRRHILTDCCDHATSPV